MATKEEMEFLEAAKQNNIDAVKCFIEEKEMRTSVTNFQLQNAAHIAVENGSLPLLKYLVSKDRELLTALDDKNQLVLHIAVRKGRIDFVKYLIEDLKTDIFTKENRYCGDTAVHMAAEEDQLTILKYFLEDIKIDVNVKDEIGGSPLFLAAEKVRMRIVKYLVEDMKANTTMMDFQRDNVLYRSAAVGDLTVPKYLLNEAHVKIDVNWEDNFNRTILQSAARHGHLDFIKYFIEQKHANIDISNNLGWTALHEAACEGHLEVVKYLVKKGAKLESKNIQGETAADVAKDERVIEYFNGTTKARNRRSLVSFRPPNGFSDESKFHPVGLLRYRIQKTITNSPSVAPYEIKSKGTSFEKSSLLSFQTFLLLTNTMMRKSKYLARANDRSINLLSPQRILEDKMDPLAINAVRNDYYLR